MSERSERGRLARPAGPEGRGSSERSERGRLARPSGPEDAWEEEEAWEHHVARLLGSLPAVEPPPGFLESAIDHRPLHGGRAAVAALGATVVALSCVVVLGVVGPGRAELSLDWLTSRHAAVAAGLNAGSSPSAAISFDALMASNPGVEMAEPASDPLSMPSDYEHEADLLTEDLRQAVYSHGNEAVSVFEQPGRADFEALGSEGIRRFDGIDAWVDEERQMMVVETQDGVVAVVGLEVDEMADVLADARPHPEGTLDATVGALMAQLGFPE